MMDINLIPYSPVVKNLGFYLDSNLSWCNQVKQTNKKIFAIMHSLKRLKNFLPLDLKRIIVRTFVMPHFDCCCLLYNGCKINILTFYNFIVFIHYRSLSSPL